MEHLSAQSVIFKDGALAEIGAALDRLSAKRVFLVADSIALAASGAERQLNYALRSREVHVFGEFKVNPKSADVEQGIRLAREFRPDTIVAVGGGTAIDLSKLIGTFVDQNASLDDLITGRAPIADRKIPLIAVPTTAGTGSEATHFAVVYHQGKKFSVAHSSLVPDVAILDPTLTHAMPKKLTASTGLDALCQAVESVWAVGATEESVAHALRALRLAWAHLESAVHNPTDESRRAMCEAAHLAGKAINISKTTAPHALSYWLTSHYGIPHGVAVAIFLGRFLEFNAQVTAADCNDPRGPEHVRRQIASLLDVLAAKDAAAGRRALEGFIANVGCPVTLREISIDDDNSVRQLVGEVNAERLSNNPRRISASQLNELLREVSAP